MNFITLIFRLIHRFSLFEAEEYAKTKAEAEMWYADIQIDEEAIKGKAKDGKKVPLWVRKLKLWSERWYAKVIYAVVFVIMVRWLHEYLNPKEDEEEDDED